MVCSGSADLRDQGQVNSLVHGGDPPEPTKEKHLVYQLLADRGKPCQADSKRGAAVFPESQPGYVPRRRGAQENCSSVLSVQFSRSVVSDSPRPPEPQHARHPCPSPAPGAYPNPEPSSSGWVTETGVQRGCRRQTVGAHRVPLCRVLL